MSTNLIVAEGERRRDLEPDTHFIVVLISQSACIFHSIRQGNRNIGKKIAIHSKGILIWDFCLPVVQH